MPKDVRRDNMLILLIFSRRLGNAFERQAMRQVGAEIEPAEGDHGPRGSGPGIFSFYLLDNLCKVCQLFGGQRRL